MANRFSPTLRELSIAEVCASIGCPYMNCTTLSMQAYFGAAITGPSANDRSNRTLVRGAFVLSKWLSNVFFGWAKWRDQWSILRHHDIPHQSRAGIPCSLRRSVSSRLSPTHLWNLWFANRAVTPLLCLLQIAHRTKTFVPNTSPQKGGRHVASALFGVRPLHAWCTRSGQFLHSSLFPNSEVRPC